MGFYTWAVLALASIVFLCYSADAASLKSGGTHVCSNKCGRYSVKESYKERYKTSCGLWGWSRCTRNRIKYRTVWKDRYCLECCDGWKQQINSDKCLIPSDRACTTPCVSGVCYDCCAGRTGDSCQTDIDECQVNNGGCSDSCVNNAGSFQCECPTGYKLDDAGFNCVDIIECQVDNGGCSDSCVNTAGSFNCECPTGYKLVDNGFDCVDINECQVANGGCSDSCVNTAGSFQCACLTGYKLDDTGFICLDIDECQVDNAGCSDSCVNNAGSFQCACPTGYKLDDTGFSCVDINECQVDNAGCSDSCVNTDGSFQCECPTGYKLDDTGFVCLDIDECQVDNGGCSDSCVNTVGSFQCECPTGYKLDDTGFVCLDIDECLVDNGGCSDSCVNTAGSFQCECPTGYKLDDTGFNCVDVNECEEANGGCDRTCVNSIGSYHCECPFGWLLDETGLKCEGPCQFEHGAIPQNYLPDPDSICKYYMCQRQVDAHGAIFYVFHHMGCGKGTAWDPTNNVCTHAPEGACTGSEDSAQSEDSGLDDDTDNGSVEEPCQYEISPHNPAVYIRTATGEEEICEEDTVFDSVECMCIHEDEYSGDPCSGPLLYFPFDDPKDVFRSVGCWKAHAYQKGAKNIQHGWDSKVGRSAQFDGASSLVVPGMRKIFTNNDIDQMTIAVWLKWSDWSRPTAGVVSSGQCGGQTPIYELHMGPGEVTSGSVDTDVSAGQTLTGDVLVPNIWGFVHVAEVYDGSTLKLYVNGEEKASTPLTGVITDNPGCSMIIGHIGSSGDAGYFKGFMDELCIYLRALDASEIGTLYNI